jgi:hypothetical protein
LTKRRIVSVFTISSSSSLRNRLTHKGRICREKTRNLKKAHLPSRGQYNNEICIFPTHTVCLNSIDHPQIGGAYLRISIFLFACSPPVRLVLSRPEGCRICAVFSFFGGIQRHLTSTYLRNTAKSKYSTKTSSFSTPILGGFSCRILAVFLERKFLVHSGLFYFRIKHILCNFKTVDPKTPPTSL